MDYYQIWCDLRPGVKDLDFADRVHRYMDHLRAEGALENYRLLRRKLGFGPKDLGEWHIAIAVKDLAQLDRSFNLAAARTGETERLHVAVYSCVTGFQSALYRDFPDPVRATPKPGA